MFSYIQDHSKMIEIGKPIFIGILSVTFVNLTNIEEILKILVLLATGGYTIWKWRKEYKDYKKNESKIN